jgi:hypothetical protein
MLNNVPHKHTMDMDPNKEVCTAAMGSCTGGPVLRLCTLCLSDLWQITYNHDLREVLQTYVQLPLKPTR